VATDDRVERQFRGGLATSMSISRRRGVSRRRTSGGEAYPKRFRELTFAMPSENGVRLAQNMQVGPCIPVEMQLQRLELAQLLGRLSHLGRRVMQAPLSIFHS
jgi:hypothetical protein